MKRLRAFTLVELLVVMVLSSIFVALAFTMFQIIQQQFVAYGTSGKIALETDNIQRLLHYDFKYAEKIETEPRQLICQHQGYTIHYLFDDNHLIRWKENSNGRDTFNIKTKHLNCFLMGQPVTNSFTDACSITIRYGNDWVTIQPAKTYSAQQLMKIQ